MKFAATVKTPSPAARLPGERASPPPAPSQPPAGEAIIRALQAASRQKPSREIRAAERHHYCVPLTLQIEDPRTRSTRTIRVASSNISSGGFAFIFDSAIAPGAIIRARFESLPGKPEISAIVRSCVHICGTQHRIGIEYH